MNPNTNFSVFRFLMNGLESTPNYRHFKDSIEKNGHYIVNHNEQKFKIYSPELLTLLTTHELPAIDRITQKELIINCLEYLNSYFDGYKEGEQYFENEYKISQNTLYGTNAEKYVRDIHLNFFHVQHNGINEGWVYAKTQCPIILTHDAIKELGYYCGIVNKVEEQVKKSPQLFATFDKCEHNLPHQQTETKTEQEIPKTFEELFYNLKHAEPCLKILSELQPPVIDAINNYIGKAKKGVFPLWVKVLKTHKPEPLIKHFKDVVYKDLLNKKVKGLNLSKDASEFRKQYKRVENNKIELDIKTILSQYSQSGKLGK